jgi:CRP-like cAMP-binding protein
MTEKADTPKKRGRGRPATGRDPLIGFRLPPVLRERLDTWAEKSPEQMTRSEAARRLIERALGSPTTEAPTPPKKKGQASRGESADQRLVKRGARALRTQTLARLPEVAEREALAERAHYRQFHDGETIFLMGEPTTSITSILSGRVRISRPAPEGREIILGELGPGEIMGELSVLDGGGRFASATAIKEVELMILERGDYLSFLYEHPAACLSLLARVTARLRRSDERMSDIGYADLSDRLAKTLLSYASTTVAGRASAPFKLSLSQSEIADMVGATRESVNRQLTKWQKEGWIDIQRGWITVLDPDNIIRQQPLGPGKTPDKP